MFAGVGAYTMVKAHMFNGVNLPTIYSVTETGDLVLRKQFTYRISPATAERKPMRVYEREFEIPFVPGQEDLRCYFEQEVHKRLEQDEIPVRFAVSATRLHRLPV